MLIPRGAIVAFLGLMLALPACGKREPKDKAAQEQQRAAQDAEEKRREEKALAKPDLMFDRAMKTQENSAKRAAEYRKKIDDEAQKKYEAGEAAKK